MIVPAAFSYQNNVLLVFLLLFFLLLRLFFFNAFDYFIFSHHVTIIIFLPFHLKKSFSILLFDKKCLKPFIFWPNKHGIDLLFTKWE